jgi:hypothetical protein
MADTPQDSGTMFNGLGPQQVTDSGNGTVTSPIPASPQNPAPSAAPSGLSASLSPAPTLTGVPPAVDAAHKTLLGKVTGDLFRGIAGGHYEDSVDPQTGKTTQTFVKAPPGEWARNTVNAALLGMGGIGPKEGEVTGLQGFLAGLTGGAKAKMELGDKQKAEENARAQQDYANQLKANEDQRQNKELSLREQLNKAQIAHENIETAVQNQVLHEHLQGQEGAASNLLITAAKDKYQDFQDAGEKPYQEGLDENELHTLMQNDKGISAKYVAIPTGQKVTKDPDGTNHIATTYSLFAPLTKVPSTLISRMQGAGLDKSAPAMFNELATAAGYDPKTGKTAPGGGADIDYRKIAVAQKEVGKQFDFQKGLDDHNLKLAEIYKDKQAGFADVLRAEKDKYDFAKEKSIDNGQQVYNAHFNPQNGDLKTDGLESTPAEFTANWQATHNGKSPSKQEVDAGLKKAAQDRADLNGYMDRMNQYYGNELLKYGKPVKDAEGNSTWTDPYAASIAAIQNNLVRGILNLQGVPVPKTDKQIQQNSLQKYTAGFAPGQTAAMSIVINKFPAGTNLEQALDFAASIPTGQGFSQEQKEALIERLPDYYRDLQTSRQSNQQKQQQVDDRTEQVKQEARRKLVENPDVSPTSAVY